MASELLSSVTGGGGGFTTKFASGSISVTTGATGTYITLTPPSGQKVKLTLLVATTTQTNLTTIDVGGSTVLTSLVLADNLDTPTSIPRVKIGGGTPLDDAIIGDVNEVIEISTNVTTTSNTIYAYQFGV